MSEIASRCGDLERSRGAGHPQRKRGAGHSQRKRGAGPLQLQCGAVFPHTPSLNIYCYSMRAIVMSGGCGISLSSDVLRMSK